MDDIKKNNSNQADHCNSMQIDLFKVCDSLFTITDRMDYLEGQSRRNNSVLDRIMETPGETWSETEEKVLKSSR